MQYGGGRPPQPGPGFGGQGIRPDPASAMKGGGPMPMPGGPQGGGPQPMPKPPAGGGGGMPDPSQMVWNMAGGGSDRGRRQGIVDDANMALRQAQLSGANPMMLAQLEQAAMQAQRGMDQWQQDEYGRQMSDRWQQQQRFGGTIGTRGGGGPGQQQQNPYFQMMLQSQLGMGGGRGGGGGPNNMGGGY